jgi:uncharacterized protein GlcG (DUF336 family)
MHVSFEEAQQIVDSAVKKSVEMGVKMCIAVLDSGVARSTVFALAHRELLTGV